VFGVELAVKLTRKVSEFDFKVGRLKKIIFFSTSQMWQAGMSYGTVLSQIYQDYFHHFANVSIY
jgi:hypothetical protein